MTTIVFWLIVIALARLVRYSRTKPPRKRQHGLCAGCTFVHMQYGATGKNALFCTFRGVVHEVKLDVLYCTDYRNRNAPPRLVEIGFAPEIPRAEAEAPSTVAPSEAAYESKKVMANLRNLSSVKRTEDFAQWVGIRLPILLAPMAGACPPSLSIAVANAGGLGACGALPMQPDEIKAWSNEFRKGSAGPFQINLWIPDPPPVRDFELERRQREFLGQWGPPVSAEAGDARLPDFRAQCQTMLSIAPKAISSIMGLYPAAFVAEMKARGILWFATATTAAEARAAEKAGADAIIAQGMEAGGHRGSFHAEEAERRMVGLMSLVPQVADAVSVPVIATGGIADARGVAAALMLGASAAMIGTGFLRCPEAKMHPAYAERLARTEAHETMITRAFSGRPGRSVATAYARAASTTDAPAAAPYPVQRGLTRAMRDAAQKDGDADRMQLWAGQSAKLAQNRPAEEVCRDLWESARRMLARGGLPGAKAT